MFVDSVPLTLIAGKGGNGVIAWRREKYIPKGGPTGGNGGHGGSVYIQADQQTLSLQGFRNKRIIAAQNGASGGPNLRQGKSGKDLILTVPCGTLIKNKHTQEVLFDLVEDGQKVKICQGGKGGKGNHHFKSPTHQAPHFCTNGTPGETLEVEFELKLIADVGLIGMPNAGKSTLLSRVTFVPVKIGAYPFTTLHPNLGYATYPNGEKILIADIPGIIEYAHLDKGLGIAFLKHIERTTLLAFVVDVSGFEGRDPLDDFNILRKELGSYNEALLERPFIVILNKIDLDDAAVHIQEFRKNANVPSDAIFEISAQTGEGLPVFLKGLERSFTLSKDSPSLVLSL